MIIRYQCKLCPLPKATLFEFQFQWKTLLLPCLRHSLFSIPLKLFHTFYVLVATETTVWMTRDEGLKYRDILIRGTVVNATIDIEKAGK